MSCRSQVESFLVLNIIELYVYLSKGMLYFTVKTDFLLSRRWCLCLKMFIEILGCIFIFVILLERTWEIFLPFLLLLEAGENRNNCPSNGSSVSFTGKVMVTYEKIHLNFLYSLRLLVCSFHLLLTSCINVLWCYLGFFPC